MQNRLLELNLHVDCMSLHIVKFLAKTVFLISMAFSRLVKLIKINIQGLKTMISYNVWFTQTTKTKMK